jgi:sulfoxide reductase heme-binding subunit YedZ
MGPKSKVRALKAVAWALGLLPLAWVSYRFFLVDGLGANPIEEVEHWSGLTSIVVLTTALSITPLRRWTGYNDLQKVRRLVGLFGFFYLCLHFSIWIGLDQFFEWQYIGEDLAERPFIIVGFSAFVFLIPMAVTSTKGWIRKLGRKWVRLHQLVYLVVPMGVIHYFWATKADDRGPTAVAVVVAILLGARVWWAVKKRRAAEARRSRTEIPAGV